MNYFLVLLLLGLGAGGYYEYTQMQGTIDGDETRIHDLSSQIDKLNATASTLTAARDDLTKRLAAASNQMATMGMQLQTMRAKEAAGLPAMGDVPPAIPAGNATAPSSLYSTHLGAISALDGRTYQDCQLLKVEADGITFSCSDGITKVPFGLLPPAMQTRFGFDPHSMSGLTQDEVDTQEEQRKAAAGR